MDIVALLLPALAFLVWRPTPAPRHYRQAEQAVKSLIELEEASSALPIGNASVANGDPLATDLQRGLGRAA